MKFNYVVRTKEGQSQTGTIEAPNKMAALQTLQDNQLIVVKLESAEKKPFFIKEINIFKGVKRKEIFVFFRQLAILVDADVPLVQSLRILSQQFESRRFREIITKMANEIDSGVAFSQSLAEHPKVFSSFAINLIKTGEVSGRLRESLDYLADHLEKEYYLITKVRGAMAYPIFILVAFFAAGILVMIMVIPGLTAILTESGQDLPWSTKIVIWSSKFLKEVGWLLIIILIGFIVFLFRYNKTKEGRAQIDAIKLKIPIFGKILQKTYLSRLSDNLGVLIKGGVSIIESLNVSGQVIGNAVFEKIIFQARDDVKIGKMISSTFEQYKEIPPIFNQMVRTGEKTGKLDLILEKLSTFYSREVESVVENISQLIEPILLVLLGIGVSILVFSVFMPIYNLAGAF